MKKILASLTLLVATMASAQSYDYVSQCEPEFGASNDVYAILEGSVVKGNAAKQELKSYLKSHKNNVTVTRDLLGRPMFTEVSIRMGEIKTDLNTLTDAAANSRVERYCSKSENLDNAICVSFCIKWTNYMSRP